MNQDSKIYKLEEELEDEEAQIGYEVETVN